MIFNYDKDDGFTTVFTRLKNAIPEISAEVDDLFKKIESTKGFDSLLDNFYDSNSFKDTTFKEWVEGLNDTQKSALTAGDALAQYKGHLEAVSKSTSTFSKVTSKVKSTLKDIGGAIGSFALNGLVGALAGELTSLLIQLPTIDNTIQETLNTTASNAGSTVSNAANEVSQYKEQISGYLDVINSQSSSIEEVTSARQGLLSVQDELINKFGSEASAVQIVTDAINGQVDALDELTQKEYFKQKDIGNKELIRALSYICLGTLHGGFAISLHKPILRFHFQE